MQQGYFPDKLKTGHITPIYKNNGSQQHFDCYRPISTLPIFGKIFEKIIYVRLYSFLINNNLMYSKQFGFRKGHSTSHALNYSINHLTSALADKNHVIGIFIDLSKAFDTISHDKLLQKLSNCGIRGSAHNLINSYLSDRSQYVHKVSRYIIGQNLSQIRCSSRLSPWSSSISYLHQRHRQLFHRW